MGFRLREIEAERKFCQESTLDAAGPAVPLAELQAALTETAVQEQRTRKLSLLATLGLTIAMNISVHALRSVRSFTGWRKACGAPGRTLTTRCPTTAQSRSAAVIGAT